MVLPAEQRGERKEKGKRKKGERKEGERGEENNAVVCVLCIMAFYSLFWIAWGLLMLDAGDSNSMAIRLLKVAARIVNKTQKDWLCGECLTGHCTHLRCGLLFSLSAQLVIKDSFMLFYHSYWLSGLKIEVVNLVGSWRACFEQRPHCALLLLFCIPCRGSYES